MRADFRSKYPPTTFSCIQKSLRQHLAILGSLFLNSQLITYFRLIISQDLTSDDLKMALEVKFNEPLLLFAIKRKIKCHCQCHSNSKDINLARKMEQVCLIESF